MGSLRLGIIISTYNAPEYLRRVLQGYADQRSLPDELLVADDGSTSATADVVRSFAEKVTFPVRHIWHEDDGFRLAKIRNEAIKGASADYLVFSDGDCLPHCDFVADHRLAAEQGCFVTGKRMLLSKQQSTDFTRCNSLLEGISFWRSGGLSGIHHLLHLPGLTFRNQRLKGLKGCNMGFFRQDLLAVNGFNQEFTGWGREDSEIAVRLFRYGLKRKDIPFGAALFHLWHPENSRQSLTDNDCLLEKALDAESFRCSNGIIKEPCQ